MILILQEFEKMLQFWLQRNKFFYLENSSRKCIPCLDGI